VAELLADGWVVDLILLMVLLEAGIIALLVRLGVLSPSALGLLPTLASGFFVLAALAAALHGAGALVTCALLATALAAHLVDLRQRLKRR
jgi:hypothetical protein